MDVREIPVVGQLAGALLALVDLLIHGGELLALLVTILVDGLLGQPELLVSLLITLQRLGERIPLLPAGAVDNLLTAALIGLLVVYIARLAGNFRTDT